MEQNQSAGAMSPEKVADNGRIVTALVELLAAGKPLYGSFRGKPGAVAAAIFVIACSALVMPAHARDNGQWGDQPASVRQWFQSLMQPDNPVQSCCGEADAFEADEYTQAGDSYLAVVTDGRGMMPNGTRIMVPNRKIKWDKGNPTGHGILFLSGEVQPSPDTGAAYVQVGTGWRILYCYVAPGGV